MYLIVRVTAIPSMYFRCVVTSVLHIYILYMLRCKLLIQNCADGDIFYFIDTYCTYQVIYLDFTDELAVKVKFFNSEQYT